MKMYADGKPVGDVLSLDAVLLDIWDSGTIQPGSLLVQPWAYRKVRKLLGPKWKARRTSKMRRQRRRQSRLSWGL